MQANVTGRYSFAIHRSKLKNNVVFDKALNSGFCEGKVLKNAQLIISKELLRSILNDVIETPTRPK